MASSPAEANHGEQPARHIPCWPLLLFVLLLPCTAPCAYLGSKSLTIARHDAAFRATAQGMTRAEVDALLPGPYETADAPVVPYLYWDDDQLDLIGTVPEPTVVRYTLETWYLSITWEYVFDQRGELVGRHRYD